MCAEKYENFFGCNRWTSMIWFVYLRVPIPWEYHRSISPLHDTPPAAWGSSQSVEWPGRYHVPFIGGWLVLHLMSRNKIQIHLIIVDKAKDTYHDYYNTDWTKSKYIQHSQNSMVFQHLKGPRESLSLASNYIWYKWRAKSNCGDRATETARQAARSMIQIVSIAWLAFWVGYYVPRSEGCLPGIFCDAISEIVSRILGAADNDTHISRRSISTCCIAASGIKNCVAGRCQAGGPRTVQIITGCLEVNFPTIWTVVSTPQSVTYWTR